MNVVAQARSFILACLGMSVAIWDIAFNLGAYGTVFYDKVLIVWVICTAVLLANWALPKDMRPVSTFGKLALSLPTLWLALSAVYLNTPVVSGLRGGPIWAAHAEVRESGL